MIPFPPKNAYVLSKECKAKLRARLFMQLEGLPIIPTLAHLELKGILSALSNNERISVVQESQKHNANEGYLNVALRLLCSQGFATQHIDPNDIDRWFKSTDLGNQSFEHVGKCIHLLDWIDLVTDLKSSLAEPMSRNIVETTNVALGYLCDAKHLVKSDSRQHRWLAHLEGLLVAPVLVNLAMNNQFDDLSEENPLIKLDDAIIHPDWQMWIMELFFQLGWISQHESSTFASPEGLFFFRRANAYGVTVSYMQTFAWLGDLLYGKANILWDNPSSKHEIHVDRTMNVWGSGGAHSTYFSKIDKIILEIFNQPINQQPQGIVDMGCGNGALLIHLHDLIVNHTIRGKKLEQYPLHIIGADLNQAALDVTDQNFELSKIKGMVLRGDIGSPDQLAQALSDKYNLDLREMLNVRSFLDHNRIYKKPAKIDPNRIGQSTGAYAFRGRRIPNVELEQELHDHFLKWMPFVAKYGLLVIELHTVDPEIAASNIGKTAITAYDATHGYTDQYIVEYPVFKNILEEVGLYIQQGTAHVFPSKELTTVSIQLLKGKH